MSTMHDATGPSMANELSSLVVEFRDSHVGSEQLKINGYSFSINRRSGTTIYWRCCYPTCHVTAVYKHHQLTAHKGQHSCPPSLKESFHHPPKTAGSVDGEPCQTDVADLRSGLTVKPSGAESPQSADTGDSEPVTVPTPPVSHNTPSPLTSSVAQQHSTCSPVSGGPKKSAAVNPDHIQAWATNRRCFSEKVSADLKRRRETTNAVWLHNASWAVETHGVHFVKPLPGVGVKVPNQAFIPVVKMEPVESRVVLDSIEEETTKEDKSTATTLQREASAKGKRKMNDNDTNSLLPATKKQKTHESIFLSVGISPPRPMNDPGLRTRDGCDLDRIQTLELRKPFCCDMCPAAFALKRIFRKHLSSHIKGKVMYCNLCGQMFKRTKMFDEHNFLRHLNKATIKSWENSVYNVRNSHSKDGKVAKTRISGGSSLTKFFQRKSNRDAVQGGNSGRTTSSFSIPIQPFNLEELKYTPLLQPKVFLSNALNEMIALHT